MVARYNLTTIRTSLRLSPTERACGDASTDGHARAKPRLVEAGYKPVAVVLVAHQAASVPIFTISLSSSRMDSHGPRTLLSALCTPPTLYKICPSVSQSGGDSLRLSPGDPLTRIR
jgi:hypothetical protein